MKRAPKPGPGHTCGRPGCGKPLPELARQHGDPFCSAECCREFYGVEYASIAEDTPRTRAARTAHKRKAMAA